MQIIRLYCHNLDLKPKILLKNFLKYLGFWVEDMSETTLQSRYVSFLDIYIIGELYMQMTDGYINPEQNKSIVILKDGYSLCGNNLDSIFYEETMDDSIFLMELISHFGHFTFYNLPFPFYSILYNLDFLKEFINSYVGNQILFLTIYENYIPFEIGSFYYNRFCSFIEKFKMKEEEKDFLNYLKLESNYRRAKYYQINNHFHAWNSKEVTALLDELTLCYQNQPVLSSLIADIHYYIENSWAKASNEYEINELGNFSYPNYMCAFILAKYVEDYRSALDVANWAIQANSNCIQAYSICASCYGIQGNYQKQKEANEQIISILNEKWYQHKLSPQELIYYYDSIKELSELYCTHFGDLISSQDYENILPSIKKEADDLNYMKIIAPKMLEDTKTVSAICNSIRKRMK